jgi:peroxiredoxin
MRIAPHLFLAFLLLFSTSLRAQDESKADEKTADKPTDSIAILPGHSAHGEAFNEGPRQSAYLMEGMANISFPTTAKDPLVQKYVEQGLAQLHGFWNYEAERSFRQAVTIDPECAIAYWGLALTNRSNEKRSKEFMAKAVEFKAKASEREIMYIDALNALIKAGTSKKKERSEAYIKALEKIVYKFPEDTEAKAMLALQLWKHRYEGGKILSMLAVSALQEEVFRANPMHPTHHYRIHLWDHENPKLALDSAAKCGQSSPGIAHMWHMPGHIYSRLKRYNDAAWQQEASARVDHSHMMRDRVLPDQIHNFAHNNEWLIRNLIFSGRVGEAVDLAKNMVELPRHPKYNMLAKRKSYSYGRSRLFQALKTYELWEDLLQLAETPYLEPTEDAKEQVKRLRALGVANLRLENREAGEAILKDVEGRLETETKKRSDAEQKAADAKIKKLVDQKKVNKAVADAVAKAQEEKKKAFEAAQKEAAEKEAAEKEAAEEKAAEDEPAQTEPAQEEAKEEAEAKDDDAKDDDAKDEEAKDEEAKDEEAKDEEAKDDDAKDDDAKDEEAKDEEAKDEEAKDEEAKDEEAKDEAIVDNGKLTEDEIKEIKEKATEESRKKQIAAKKKDLDKAKADARRPFDNNIRELERAVQDMQGNIAVLDGDFKKAIELLGKAGGEDAMRLAWLRLKSGDADKAIADATKNVTRRINEVQPLAWMVWLYWEADKKDKAKESFEKLRKISSPIDLSSPVFARLAPIAKSFEYPEDWRVKKEASKDVGDRPDLDSLGPFRWQPTAASPWELKDADGKVHSLANYEGKPVVVIFYLGFGCLHCAEQLHKFAPMTEEFRKAGIEVIAVSSDDEAGLKQSIEDYDKGKMPFPLVSNSDRSVFKQYRCYDDFEKSTLHGTFIIDGKGRVRWQDISYEPFMDPGFVLKEAKRLIAQ